MIVSFHPAAEAELNEAAGYYNDVDPGLGEAYGVIYQLTDDGIRIIAVAHAQQRPGYWQARK